MELKKCKFCNAEFELPEPGESNDHWRWASGKQGAEHKNSKGESFRGGWRCKEEGKAGREKRQLADPASHKFKNRLEETVDQIRLDYVSKMDNEEKFEKLVGRRKYILCVNAEDTSNVKVYSGFFEIEEDLGIERSSAIQSCTKVTKTAHGYVFRYLLEPEDVDTKGMVFGELTVTSEHPELGENGWYFNCNCSCGNTHSALVTVLRSGHTKGCGCLRGTTGNGRKYEETDFVGKVIGKYTILESKEVKTGRSNGELDTKYRIKIKCNDCGYTNETYYGFLQQTGGIACKNCIETNHKDEVNKHIGETYNRLTIVGVKKVQPIGHKKTYRYECKCSCGSDKVVSVPLSSLVSGGTKSCGCLSRELSSSRMSELTAKNSYLGHISHKYKWYFVKDGEQIKCRSSYEVLYAKYLMENNIKFKYEPETFILSESSRYTPDFYLMETDEYVEVKGWDGIQSQIDARELFKKDHNLLMIGWEDLVKMCGLSFSSNGTMFNHAKASGMEPNDYVATTQLKNI